MDDINANGKLAKNHYDFKVNEPTNYFNNII